MKHILALICLLFATAAFANDLSARILVDGNNVHIKVNTPSAPGYRCTYSVSITFTDGTTETSSGTTEPATGAQNHSAAIIQCRKPVREARLVSWSCSRR